MCVETENIAVCISGLREIDAWLLNSEILIFLKTIVRTDLSI